MSTQKNFLLSNCLTTSFFRNKNFYVLHTTKIICFLLVILSISIPVRSHIVKRNSMCDSAYPGNTPLNVLFCKPLEGEKHEIGQIVNLSWNPSNAKLFGADAEVQVYLFRKQQNATGVEEAVILNPKNLTEYLVFPRENNSMNFTAEIGWLPSSTPSENNMFSFSFKVIPKGIDNNFDDSYSSPYFIVLGPKLEPGSGTKSTISVTTIQAIPTEIVSTSSIDSKAQNRVRSENNAFIIVASVSAFLAFIAIVIAVKSRRRNNNPTKHQSLSNLSASSSTPMITPLSIGKFGSNNRDSESPVEAESIHSTTPLANKEEMRLKPKSTVSFSSNENQPISASDAALLSDAFRKVLRKPDWKPEDEEDDDTNLSQEERLRRREAKELMKKELAEEGTDLQNISIRHTKVEIHNINDELDKDGASRSSESGSN
uniref:Uncharacterized protein n=1 Tax=Anthurium amnicola TaxID=1678845 RepID=A0A1D1XDT8_9ARAE